MANVNKTHKAYITRRVTFSAAHRLHSKHITDEDNVALYGKCNHPGGHGHNYTAEVTLYGSVDPITGMILNLTDLKKCMKLAITNQLDHKNLDADVDFFSRYPSTVENVAIFIWQRLQLEMTEPSLLYEVKVHETENNMAIYRGE